MEEFPLTDALDHEILMHRNAHFGGKFEFMIDYYLNEGKGVNQEFELERLHELARLEQEIKTDLATMLLSDEEQEHLSLARAAYEKLHALADKDSKTAPHAIARLILSEEEKPEAEMEALLKMKEKATPFLIEMLKNQELYDPLFPGYGLSPNLAAEILGSIGGKKACITLFEHLSEGDFFDDEITLKALKTIGEPAKGFLLKVAHAKPYTFDNEKAAIALELFKDDPLVSSNCFQILKNLDLKKQGTLASYLILNLSALKDTPHAKELREMFKNDQIPKTLRNDIGLIIDSWKE